MIDTFVAEQGAGGEVTEDLDDDIVREVGQCVPLVGASSILSIMRSLNRKITQQRSNIDVHNSYQRATLTTINNFHGTTSKNLD